MNKLLFSLAVFLSASLYAEMKPHEMWWEKNLGEAISWDTFYSWLGDEEDCVRPIIRNHVIQKNYNSFLDVGCGLCVDFWNLLFAKEDIDYLGIDITPKLVTRAKQLGINVTLGSVEALPLPDNSFDMSFARHLICHLDSYEKAISELIRVAKKEVLLVLLIAPHSGPEDKIVAGEYNGCLLYHNVWSKKKMEDVILANPKVRDLSWDFVAIDNNLLHIYLKDTH